MQNVGGSAWPDPRDRYVIAVGGIVTIETTWGALLAGLTLPIGSVVIRSDTLKLGDRP